MLETEHLEPFRFFFISFFIIIICGKVTAQTYPDAVVDSLLKKGIKEIVNQQYDLAKENYYNMNKDYPDLPLGKIYLAATGIARAYDYAEDLDNVEIKNYLDEAKKQSEQLLEKDNRNVWNYYFAALVGGYTAYYQALKKNWLAALSDGLNSLSGFEKCLSKNPQFYDAYAAIGTFKYWKSRKTEFLNWLPFVEDERQKGIYYLTISVNHNYYNKYLAYNSLFWVYIDKKDFKKAANLAQKALNENPGSRLFNWCLARAYEPVDTQKAIQIYYQVLNSYRNIPGQNHYNEIVLMHIIAQQYQKLGENKKALQLCSQILSIKDLSDFVKKKLGNRLERVRELQQHLSK